MSRSLSGAAATEGKGGRRAAAAAPTIDLGQLFLSLAPRGFGFVAEALNRVGSSLDGWGRDDVLSLGAAAAARVQLLRLSGGGVRGRLAAAVRRAAGSPVLPVHVSAAELAVLQTAEPLLHPSVLGSLARMRPVAAGAGGEAAAAALVRDAELASAAYAHSTAEFCARAAVAPEDVLACSWDVDADALVPAHCLLVDRGGGGDGGGAPPRLVLVIRGTKQLGDALLDVSAAPEALGGGTAHAGVLRAARSLAAAVAPALQAALASPAAAPAASERRRWRELTLVGHSLGGGIAAVLGLLAQSGALGGPAAAWAPPARGGPAIRATSFGCPPIVSAGLASACRPWLTAVLHADDVLPRLNLRAAAALRAELAGYDVIADTASALLAAYPAEAGPALAQFAAASRAAAAAADLPLLRLAGSASGALGSAAGLALGSALSAVSSSVLQALPADARAAAASAAAALAPPQQAVAALTERVVAWLRGAGAAAESGPSSSAGSDAAAAAEELEGRHDGDGATPDPVSGAPSARSPSPRQDLEYFVPGRPLYLLWRSTWAKAAALYPEDAAALRAGAVAAGCPADAAPAALGDLPVALLALAAEGRVVEAAAPPAGGGAAASAGLWPLALPPSPRAPAGLSRAAAAASLGHARRIFAAPGRSAPSAALADVSLVELVEEEGGERLFDAALLTPYLVRDHIARPTLVALQRWAGKA